MPAAPVIERRMRKGIRAEEYPEDPSRSNRVSRPEDRPDRKHLEPGDEPAGTHKAEGTARPSWRITPTGSMPQLSDKWVIKRKKRVDGGVQT